MPKNIDLSGQCFGKLTVKCRDDKDHRKWVCLCDCGREHSVFTHNLVKGRTTSCGCSWKSGRKPKFIEEGTRFGKLTVIKSLGTRTLHYCGSDSTTRQFFLCQCDCGNTKEISLSDLQAGVKTCGCGKRGRGAKNE